METHTNTTDTVTVFVRGLDYLVFKDHCDFDDITKSYSLRLYWYSHYGISLETPVLEHENLDLLTVKELKAKAMAKCDAMAVKKSWIQTTTKESLVDFL